MDSFVEYYPDIYSHDDLQTFADAGLISQKVVDARFAEVEAAKTAQA
ncbi:hypothetical protein PQ472_05275 [Lacticaseibacillus pabuli]|uniref:XkdX-like protein n=1 Tax=Lacticaseibacillus pabuli TaxID=3025672 RepID=A0ABY7WX57_9LACO|nr:hypothetical protein [Lacticaseibacillus sp. KACC 23028]WDF83649.1 hypothetical protein PQ472_05275 [Lacticaseibacillus sp. KACC 23028]